MPDILITNTADTKNKTISDAEWPLLSITYPFTPKFMSFNSINK
jgi:hypothetical protein